MLKQYVSKPWNIEAMKLQEDPIPFWKLYDWLNQHNAVIAWDDDPVSICIDTIHGNIDVHVGDYVVQLDDGRFVVYCAEIFEKSFEEIIDES